MPYYALSLRDFVSIFTMHLPHNTNFRYLTTNKWLKCTKYWGITVLETAKSI